MEINLSLFKNSDYARKKEKVSKTKIPTQLKSQVQYCRNCNCKNKDSAKTCVQCEITLKEPKMRRRMR